MGQLDLLSSSEIGQCSRCGEKLRVDPNRNPDARMLRRAKTADGVCVNCALRAWFEIAGEVGAIRDLDPKQLLIPMIQEQMGRVIRAAKADADPAEIDWTKLVRDWDLPLDKGKPKRVRKVPN